MKTALFIKCACAVSCTNQLSHQVMSRPVPLDLDHLLLVSQCQKEQSTLFNTERTLGEAMVPCSQQVLPPPPPIYLVCAASMRRGHGLCANATGEIKTTMNLTRAAICKQVSVYRGLCSLAHHLLCCCSAPWQRGTNQEPPSRQWLPW